jgi:hypothetical protein
MNLQDILGKYGVPDPSIVGKLPRGGITLDFVGHAEITKILIEVDPQWSWEPVAWTADGRPAINTVNGMAVMWGRLTVLGQSRLGVGSARHDKPDLDKELIGDFLRNAAMRFGISLSLWSKSEWEEQAAQPRKPVEPKPMTQDFVAKFRDACTKQGLNADEVAEAAGVNLATLTDADMPKLRDKFNQLKNQPTPADVVNADNFIAHVKEAFPTAEKIADTPQIKDPESPATQPQIAKVRAMLAGKGFGSYTDKLEKVRDLLNNPDLKKIEQLTKGEASMIINTIEKRGER